MSDNIATTNDRVGVKNLFEQPSIKQKFQQMLGQKAEGFIVSVISAVNTNSELSKSDANSVLYAAATAASMDLPVNSNLGFAHIIPYKGKAQFQMGYKGFIQLAQRSGLFKTISAAPIFEGQLVSEDPLAGYEFNFKVRDSDKVIGYAAYFKLLNGFEKTLYMTVEELQAHGRKYSKSYSSGQWAQNFEAMALKTVLKLLLSKYAPLSIEMQRAVLVDQSAIKSWDGEVDVEYVDNDSRDLDTVVQNKEEARIRDFIEKAKTKTELKQAEEYCLNLDDDHELKDLYKIKLASL